MESPQDLPNRSIKELRAFLTLRGVIPSGGKSHLIALSELYFNLPVIQVEGPTTPEPSCFHDSSTKWHAIQSLPPDFKIPVGFNLDTILNYLSHVPVQLSAPLSSSSSSLLSATADEQCLSLDDEMDGGTIKPSIKGRKMYASEKLSLAEGAVVAGKILLRGHCEASMKKLIIRRPQIAIDNHGRIVATKCDCEARADGRCCHVATLLFLAEAVSLKLECKVRADCTSMPQTWRKGSVKKNDPAQVYIHRYNSKFDTERYKCFDPAPQMTSIPNEHLLRAIQSAHSTHTMWEDILFYEYGDYQIDSERKNILNTQVKKFLSSLLVESKKWMNDLLSTPRYIHVSETMDQTTCSLWHTLRFFRITGSNFKDFCLSPLTRAKSLWTKPPEASNIKAVQWGLDQEEIARSAYQLVSKTVVRKAGFVIPREFPQFGYSPDGLVGEDGLLEIKCPYSLRNTTLDEIFKAVPKSGSFSIDQNGDFCLKRTHEYYYQVQLGLWVLGKQFVEFVW